MMPDDGPGCKASGADATLIPYAENNHDRSRWPGGNPLALLAGGIRGQTVWRDVSMGDDGGQPDWLPRDRRGVLSH